MPKIGQHTPYSERPCERCGGKRAVSKTWTEKITTEWGTTILNHTQVICLNKECQAEFDRVLLKEKEKREVMKAMKENSTRPKTATARS